MGAARMIAALTRALPILGLGVFVQAAVAQQRDDRSPSWVGRWYVGDAKVCKSRPGQAEGLVVYTAKETIGYEGKCSIEKAVPKGSATRLTLRCRGEGSTSTDHETVEVIDGRLHRTTLVEGRQVTFKYPRCPRPA